MFISTIIQSKHKLLTNQVKNTQFHNDIHRFFILFISTLLELHLLLYIALKFNNIL